MPLSRRRFVRVAGGLGLATACLPLLGGCDGSAPSVREGPPARVYRIGWLNVGPPLSDTTPLTWTSPPGPVIQRFLDRLAELGYVEGRTLHWEYRGAIAPDQLAAYATELVERGVDVILVLAAPNALRAAFQAPGSTPVVMAATTGDPVGDGYAQSLGHPGGKVTGVTFGPPGPVWYLKRLEIFKEALPTLARLGVLLDVSEELPAHLVEAVLARLGPAARELGVELVIEEVRTLDELDGAFAALARAGANGVLPYVRVNWTGVDPGARIVAAALRHRLPTNGMIRHWADSGALFVYSVDYAALYGRTAEYVDKVLRGARPADLPIENPDKFELVINLATAQSLGLTIPSSVIARATEVIQ